MIQFPRLVSACVRPVRTLTSSYRLFSASSSAQFRRPLDLEEDHIESVSLRREASRTSEADSQFPPIAEYDGPKERSMNTVTLLGRVGMDPVLRGTEENPVTTFTMATNTFWKSGSEWREKTEWHNIVVFKPWLRENAMNINKGARLHVTGRLTYGKYVDREGVERQTTSIMDEMEDKETQKTHEGPDTKVYPDDYVTQLFNNIDWNSRKKSRSKPETTWLESDTWRSSSYTMKYLNYQLEEGQVDLTNPFHIEEGNKIRSRLERKKGRKKNEVTEFSMVTEGLKDVEGSTTENEDKGKAEEEEDYLDEYGNLKEHVAEEDNMKTDNKSKDESIRNRSDSKDTAKTAKDKSKGKKNPGTTKSSEGWKDLDSQESSEARKYVSSAVKVPDSKLMFPRESSLDWFEQETFLHKQSLARIGHLTPSSGTQWTAYQNFATLVSEEQEEFNIFTRENFNPSPSSVSEDHRKYVTEHRAARISRPLSLPRHWTKLKDVRLAGATDSQLCALLVEQTLVELGTRPKANIPSLIRTFKGKKACRGMSLPSQYLRMVHKVPPDPSIMPGTIGLTRGQDRRRRRVADNQTSEPDMEEKVDSTKYLFKESCIDDPNCSLLAQHVVPDIIISAAALKCLMDNHRKTQFSKTWEIPFVVRTFQSEVDSRTVVIFGKPLLAREVTDEDFSVLAHKIALQVGLFQRDWEATASKKASKKLVETVSPIDDLFGEADVAIEELEVFGSDVNIKSMSALYQKNDAKKEMIAQLDGGDTDSEDEQLVISESPRRSTRLRTSESESDHVKPRTGRGRGKAASSQVVRRSVRGKKKKEEADETATKSLIDTSGDMEEILDYEPEDNNKNPTPEVEISSSSEADEDESSELVQSILKKKISLAQETKLKTTLFNEDSSSSSSEEDNTATAALLEKKLRAKLGSNVKSTEEKEKIESSSDETSSEESGDKEDAQALLLKKMAIMKNPNASHNNSQITNLTMDEKDSDEEVEISSPKKKVQRLLSSDSENEGENKEAEKEKEDEQKKKEKEVIQDGGEDEQKKKEKDKEVKDPNVKLDPITKKLAELGRENVDVKKLQKKISLEKKLKVMSELKERKSSIQSEDRNQRLSNRNKKDSENSTGNEGEKEQEITSSKTTRSALLSSSDSEEDEERFDKFSNSKPNLLDNLLTGQNKLLSTEGRKKVEEKPQQNPAVFQAMTSVAAGLPTVDQFKPPLPGTNVSYRLWKLFDKSAPSGRRLRVVVRSKVAGVTKEDKIVTPSVKVEHQSQFGAEQVTASQAIREWISTLVRPSSNLVRVRVTPDSKISMIEEKNLGELTAECRKLEVDPGKQLVNLYNVFSELSQLKAGQFILKHSSKTGAFCEVYEAVGEGHGRTGAGLLDLHKMYSTLQPEVTVPGKLSYSPIDTSVVTPWHQVYGRVPGTFEPAGVKSSGSKRGRGAGRGGRGGRGGAGGDKGGGGAGRGRGGASGDKRGGGGGRGVASGNRGRGRGKKK